MRGAFAPAAKTANCSLSGCIRCVFYVTIIFTCVFAFTGINLIKRFTHSSFGESSKTFPLQPKVKNAAYEELTRTKLSDPSALQDYLWRRLEETEEPWWENRNSSKTLYVDLFTGIANILQTMASAYTVAYRENINIKIVFWGSRLRPANWDDLFSFPKVNFLTRYPDGARSRRKTKACPISDEVYVWKNTSDKIQWVKNKHGSGEIGCTKACCWREEPFPESMNWFYKSLRPTNEIQEKID